MAINFFFLICISIIIFILRIVLNYYMIRFIFEWLLFSNIRINLEILIFLDWISCLFIRIVILISSFILLYRIIYINNDLNINRFVILVLLFVFSIILIIIRPNLIRIIIGWDGLGVTSYCLVIYYQNYDSFNSGILTILMNRIGDVGLLIGIILIITYGRWNINILKIDKLIMIIILVAALTKRAQVPFNTWLPKAMAAPTPVSALVHSSTLVTAGVYLLIRFRKYLIEVKLNVILLILSILTIFISRLIACIDYDLKKIIALSTLSQLGLIIIILSMGFSLLSFYHLLIHAIFKSILFICAGIIIHRINNNQDIRKYGNLNIFLPYTIISFYVSLLSLTGILFFSGFYSKDLIYEFIYIKEIKIIIYLIVVTSLILTIIYSIRLFKYLFFRNIKYMGYFIIKENLLINLSIFTLVILRIIMGRLLNWLFFYMDLVGPYLPLYIKIITMVICMLGGIIFIFLKIINVVKYNYLLYFLISILGVNTFWTWWYSSWLNLRIKIYRIDKGWLEFYWKSLFLNLVEIKLRYLYRFNYKIYIFINLFISFIVLIYVFF